MITVTSDAYLKVQMRGYEDVHLVPTGKLTIGRNSLNEIQLRDPSVSRLHALMYWFDRYPKIVDCQSLSGLEVDGNPVQTFEFVSHHTVKIGKCILTCDLIQKSTSKPANETDTLFDSAIREDLDNVNSVVLFREAHNGEIRGTWNSLEDLHKLLCGLESNRRTGTLNLCTTKGDPVALVLFGLGEIKEAKCKDYTGKKALMKVCSGFKRGSYTFTPKITVVETSLSVSALTYTTQIAKLIGRQA